MRCFQSSQRKAVYMSLFKLGLLLLKHKLGTEAIWSTFRMTTSMNQQLGCRHPRREQMATDLVHFVTNYHLGSEFLGTWGLIVPRGWMLPAWDLVKIVIYWAIRKKSWREFCERRTGTQNPRKIILVTFLIFSSLSVNMRLKARSEKSDTLSPQTTK